MRAAFKEWAIVVDALGRGEQIIILRKGGIAEGRSGFQVEHKTFLLFPTRFHQQRESVVLEAQVRFDEIAARFPATDRVRLEFFGEVIAWHQLDSLSAAERLRGQHIWRDEVVAQRFDWGRTKNIFALAMRVFRLPHVTELAALEEYGGCKSWIELETDVTIEGARPVLSESEFTTKLSQFDETLERAVST